MGPERLVRDGGKSKLGLGSSGPRSADHQTCRLLLPRRSFTNVSDQPSRDQGNGAVVIRNKIQRFSCTFNTRTRRGQTTGGEPGREIRRFHKHTDVCAFTATTNSHPHTKVNMDRLDVGVVVQRVFSQLAANCGSEAINIMFGGGAGRRG